MPKGDPQATPTSDKPRVLVCDDLAPVALERMAAQGMEVVVRTGLDEAALCAAAADFEAVIVRSATRITKAVIEAAPKLRVIGRAGVGVDNVDCDAATRHGVVVMNTPTGNSTTTGELAIALLLSLARRLPQGVRRVLDGNWSKKGLVGTEITGKTLGVIGLGRIGRVVAERGLGLKLNVIAFDPYLSGLKSGGSSPVPGVELVDFETLLENSDFISLHVPLVDATRHLISWKEVARMRKGAFLINAARGGIVDEEAVLDALEDGHLAGAAFDVLESEPPSADNPMLQRDDVIVTPHLGASSREAQVRVAHDIADQISDFLNLGVARNAVNAPTLPAAKVRELAPYLLLAEKIGLFLSQTIAGPIRKLELVVGGEAAIGAMEHLKLALMVGCLRKGSGSSDVNFVNAPLKAREAGLRILESTESEPTFVAGQIDVRATPRAEGESHRVVGAVFGSKPHLVRIDHAHMDLPAWGNLLITAHRDRPGVLGELGTLLGANGVNIRRLELAPAKKKGAAQDSAEEALASGYLTLDQEPEASVLEKLKELDAVEKIYFVKLS